MTELELSSHGDFLLGDWIVQPRLSRIIRGDQVERLEPRCIDLLVFFARYPEEVHSRERLIDEVWRVEAVAENTLTHAIAEIRKALGDDAREPRYIETIHRRGYRLLVTPGPVSDEQSSISRTVSHFLLLEQIGAGGMGVVYRALDRRLGRDVAIKMLPDDVARDEERLVRFEREARLLASLNHPNIATLYGLEEHDGRRFLVMELVDGESLATKIEQGPLTVDRAVNLALQITAGLEAAHGRGVIHRDLKPANVMVNAEGQVKILDFGLAATQGAVDGEAATASIETPLTRAGSIMGTVGYMAPEQVRGERADHRSDIFAFGCVLYEMLTGKQAFKRDSAAEFMAAILREDPPPLSEAGAQLPPEVSRAVEHCLEKDPDRRYQSASDLAFDLDSFLSKSDHQSEPDGAAFRRTPQRLVPWAALVIAVVIIGGLVLRSMQGTSKATNEQAAQLDRKTVVVFPFENRSGDPTLDAFGLSAASLIKSGLERGRQEIAPLKLEPVMLDLPANLIEENGGAGLTDNTKSLVDLARAQGAATFVSGAISGSGDELQLLGRVVDTATGQSVRIEGPVVASRPTLDDAVAQISKRLMSSVAWHLGEFFLLSLAEPPDWDTYLFFIEGNRPGMHRSELEKHLKEVLEIDPRFIPARLLLALIYSNMGRRSDEEALLADLEQDSAKMSRFGREDLSLRRSHLAGDWLKCLDSTRRKQDLKPEVDLRPQLMYYLDLTNRMLELADVTSELLDDFGEKPPPLFFAHNSNALHMLGRHEEEVAVAQKGRELYPSEIPFWSLEAAALAALGRFNELLALLDGCTTIATQDQSSITTDPQNPGTVFETATVELLAHRHREESLDVASRLVEWRKHAQVDGTATQLQRMGLAYAFYLAERWDEARSLLEDLAVEVVDPDDRDVMRIHGLLGVIAARQGERQKAQRISGDLTKIAERSWGQRSDWRAQIAAQLGDGELALRFLRQAIAEGRSISWFIHSESAYEPLWDDPRFQELVRPKG